MLPEVPIEGDCLSDAKALCNHEAQSIAERVGLILVVTEESDGAYLVIVGHAYDLAQTALDMLQEAKSGLSSFTGAVRKQRVRLETTAFVVTRCQPSRSACVNNSQARTWRASSETR